MSPATAVPKRAATQFLIEGRYAAMFEHGADPAGMNALFPQGLGVR